MDVAGKEFQDDRKAAPIRSRSVQVDRSGLVSAAGRAAVGDDPNGVVLVTHLSDDPVVKLVEVFVVAGEHLCLEQNVVTDPEINQEFY